MAQSEARLYIYRTREDEDQSPRYDNARGHAKKLIKASKNDCAVYVHMSADF